MVKSIPVENILPGLPNLELLFQLNESANEQGVQLYLLGGSVRDLLLGRPINDLDFVVDRNPISFAKQFANAIDAAFVKLEDQPATVRVVIRSDQSNIDFTQFRSDNLELDLRLRDLTINAIAFNLNQLFSEYQIDLIDPYNGLGDLEAQVIRFCSERVVADDPLRLLRAYRFSAQLRFNLPVETIALTKKYAERLTEISMERISGELLKTLSVDDSVDVLRLLSRNQILSSVIPELEVTDEDLAAVAIFESERVPDMLQKYYQDIDEYLQTKLLGDFRCHEIVKLAIFLGSTKALIRVVKRLCLSNKALRLIKCIHHHQSSFVNLIIEPLISRHEIIQFLRKIKQDWVSVALYVYARIRSQGQQTDNAESRIPEIASFFYLDFLEIVNQGGLINGNEVMCKYEVTQGVELGQILRHIEDLQFKHAIQTKSQAFLAVEQFLKEKVG
ncbi:MAG: hypothetical protein NZ961_15385 [Candidatus Poribacteria bacterium]|nr:hypothetical protein [Candidatus Poribacteria bacterium]